MFIPAILVTIVTFPGIIVHELAHQLFCRWFKIPVFEVCYFRIGNPAGYVIHEVPQKYHQSLFISIGPFIINTLLAFIIGFPAALQFKFDSASFSDYFLVYLAVSIGAHAFPSVGDAGSLWKSVMNAENKNWFIKLITVPAVGVIYLGAIGSFFWLDIIYGMGVGVGLPYALIEMLV